MGPNTIPIVMDTHESRIDNVGHNAWLNAYVYDADEDDDYDDVDDANETWTMLSRDMRKCFEDVEKHSVGGNLAEFDAKIPMTDAITATHGMQYFF